MSACPSDTHKRTNSRQAAERIARRVVAAAGLCALAGGTSPGLAGEFGSFSLKPGETQQIRVGPIYRNLRVCNEAGSAGSILVTIDDHNPHLLAAGVCAEDLGDSFVVVNRSNGPVRGTYRPVFEIPFEG